jgi:hypothetical protein
LAQATPHVHIDHESCLEVTVLKGRGAEVKTFADQVIAERGVRHGHIVMMRSSLIAMVTERRAITSNSLRTKVPVSQATFWP